MSFGLDGVVTIDYSQLLILSSQKCAVPECRVEAMNAPGPSRYQGLSVKEALSVPG